MFLGIGYSEHLRSEDTSRGVKFFVFHQEEAFTAYTFFCSLDRFDARTEDWKSHVLADQVRIGPQLYEACMDVPIAKLAHKTLLNDFLVCSLVVGNLQSWLLRQSATLSSKRDQGLSTVLLVSYLGGW